MARDGKGMEGREGKERRKGEGRGIKFKKEFSLLILGG